MKKHLEIIRGFGLFLLLVLLVSAVAVGTPKVSVTIVQVSSSGEGDDANTVTNTYTEESESPNTHVTGEISGNDASTTTNEDGTTPTESTDSGESTDPGVMPSFEIGESTLEEYSDELSKWISSMLDEDDLLLANDDFQQGETDIINVE